MFRTDLLSASEVRIPDLASRQST